MSNTNDNFDSLWASFKSDIAAARMNRDKNNTMIQTYRTRSGMNGLLYGGQLMVSKADLDGCSFRIYGFRSSCTISADPEDLRAIAAHCLLAAQEIEQHQEEDKVLRLTLQP